MTRRERDRLYEDARRDFAETLLFARARWGELAMLDIIETAAEEDKDDE